MAQFPVSGYGEGKPFRPPPYKPIPEPTWATYCYNRHPQWKIHQNAGFAKNAIGLGADGKPQRYARGGIIFRLVDGLWTEYARIEGQGLRHAANTSVCSVCDTRHYEDDYLCPKCRNL